MTNPEVLRLAREIAFNFHGSHPIYADTLLEMLKNGEWDGSSEVQIAIAAIEKTTELLAEASRRKAQIHHRIAAENGHLREGHLALSSAYITVAEEAERYDHLRQSEKDNSDAD